MATAGPAKAYLKRLGGSATGLKHNFLLLTKLKLFAFYSVSISVLFILAILLNHELLNYFVDNKFLFIIAGICLAGIWGYFVYINVLRPVEKIVAAQRRFIADAAHELRIPLTNIKTNDEVALLAGENLKINDIIGTLKDNIEEVDRMSSIIKNLTDISHLNNEQVAMTFSKIDLAQVVSKAIQILGGFAEQKNIKVAISKLDAAAMWGNHTALEEMAVNIIKNAIAYTPKNGLVNISVENKANENIVEFSVKDNGIGIDAKDLPHVFDPFFRSDKSRSRATSSQGAGLGLAIVREIIQQHQGSVKIKSEPNKGTTVSVKFLRAKTA